MDLESLNYEFLRPMVTAWTSRIEAADKGRANWTALKDECLMFYSKSAAAMWDGNFRQKFWQGSQAPKFRMTINKAFELVAVYGPHLLYDTPHRRVEPKDTFKISDELGMLLQSDPAMQPVLQQMQFEQVSTVAKDKTTASLLQYWLNYTPREQPGGGLVQHSELAVMDILLKGRGCLWARPYQMPGSQRVLTGCFREPPENLLTDPDFKTLQECRWVVRRCVHSIEETERRFRLPEGSLKKSATLESIWSQSSNSDDTARMHRAAGDTNDLMVYYEVFSKIGCGCPDGVPSAVRQHLKNLAGQYVYLVIAPNVPYPLNFPTEALRRGMKDDEARERLAWPIPFWKDDKWPVSVCDMYYSDDSAWPMPPLAFALGQLKFLNTMMSHLCNRIWSSSRDFIAVAKAAYKDMLPYLEKGDDLSIIPVEDVHGDVNKTLTFLQQPQTNYDVWRIMDAVSLSFDKATGLSDILYGYNVGGTQSRSAEETAAKRDAAALRPNYMQKRVAQWQSDVAASEAFVASRFVKGADVAGLVGHSAAALWDSHVAGMDDEKVLRQMAYTIEAGSIRRPNIETQIANIAQAMPALMPILANYGYQFGNFQPFNRLVKEWADANQMKLGGMDLPDLPSGPAAQEAPPDPQMEQQMQAQQQLEQQAMQADARKMEAEVAKAEAEAKRAMTLAEREDLKSQIQTQEALRKAAKETLSAEEIRRRNMREDAKLSDDLRTSGVNRLLTILKEGENARTL